MTDWGPADYKHRTEFLQGICKHSLGYVPSDLRTPGDGDREEGGEGGGNHLNISQVWSTGAGGSTAALRNAASCQALHSLLNEGEFYQSKLSIAEKMAELHTKDLVKQGVPVELLASTDRVSRVRCCSDPLQPVLSLKSLPILNGQRHGDIWHAWYSPLLHLARFWNVNLPF